MIREAGCLVILVAAFDGADPKADLRQLRGGPADRRSGYRLRTRRTTCEDSGPQTASQSRRAADRTRGPDAVAGGAGIRAAAPARAGVDSRAAASHEIVSAVQRKAASGVINTSDAEDQPERFPELADERTHALRRLPGPGNGTGEMDEQERDQFCEEMEVAIRSRSTDPHHHGRSGQMLFFTAGEKEVRTWMIRSGGTALRQPAISTPIWLRDSSAPKP
jgi:hypothetical protein